jgi:hypothetical protein
MFAKSLVVGAPQIGISQAEHSQRPTDTPYTGDLSIFEKSGRDERLQRILGELPPIRK